MHAFSLTNRSDSEVLAGVKKLAGRERETTAWLVAHLAEIDARGLFRGEGCSCVLKYCTEVLHLSEPAANRRIHAARVARKFPVVFRMLYEGSIHLTTVSILGPCLTPENHKDLLQAARHKTKEELLLLAASINPKPDVPSTVRKLPARQASGATLPDGAESGFLGLSYSSAASEKGFPSETVCYESETTAEEISPVPPVPAPIKKAIVAPLSPERYRVQFTASAETTQKLRQLQELLRHQIPNGDPALVIERAIDVLHQHVMQEKVAQVKRPRNKPVKAAGGDEPKHEPERAVSRHIPSEVKRAVWDRDGGQCAFVSRSGRRCSERGRIEFHHLEPYGWGGPATIENISLRCRTHNTYEGERVFGRVVRAKRAVAEAVGASATG